MSQGDGSAPSMLFEIDLQTQTLCDENVQVLILRNLGGQASGPELDCTQYNNWASMLSKLFVTPTQEILKIAHKYREMEGERRLTDSEKSKGRRLYNNKSHEANLH